MSLLKNFQGSLYYGQTTVYDPNASQFALIENPANGSPFYGAFKFKRSGKVNCFAKRNEFGRGERGVSYGAGHIEEKDGAQGTRFIAENTGWDSYMDMLSGLGRELTNKKTLYTKREL